MSGHLFDRSKTRWIYHITTKAEWNQAQVIGIYDRSTKGKSFDEVGFIHASLENQLEQVAKFVYGGTNYGGTNDELIVLVMDLDDLDASDYSVRFEDGGNGELYPHIYAPISIDSVIDTREGKFDDLGNFLVIE